MKLRGAFGKCRGSQKNQGTAPERSSTRTTERIEVPLRHPYVAFVRCIITAGPTYEPLDQVRRLTNFSTGRLGSALAAFLAKRGHEVRLLLGDRPLTATQAWLTWRRHSPPPRDLRERLKNHGSSATALFHAAAVSDFTFGQVWVRSPGRRFDPDQSGEDFDTPGDLDGRIIPTQKIISECEAGIRRRLSWGGNMKSMEIGPVFLRWRSGKFLNAAPMPAWPTGPPTDLDLAS